MVKTRLQYKIKYLTKDFARNAEFYLSRRRRREWRAALSSSHDLPAWYDFSREVFGITQIRAEITPFLEFVEERAAPRLVCEIGTQTCGNMFLFSRAFPRLEHLIGLDLVVQNWPRMKYFARPGLRLTALNGSSYDPATIARVTNLLAGRKLDFLFIDGDHRYDGVKRDFLNYASLVRDGGIIAFHDIKPSAGSTTSAWSGDVPVLWERIQHAYPSRRFVKSEQQHGCGIGAIEYDSSARLPDDL